MHHLTLTAAVAALATAATAQVTTTDPGLFTGIDDHVEARVRLDGGNSQTWKLAFWQDGNTPVTTNGNANRNFFQDGAVNPFELTYSAATGALRFQVDSLVIEDTFLLAPGEGLAGLKYFVTSTRDDGITTASDLRLSLNGGPEIDLQTAQAGLGSTFNEPPVLFFDQPVSDIRLTGNVVFDWLPGANLQGDRFRLSINLNTGTPIIPAPGAAALAGLALLAAARRRR